jgi:H+/Cl- antiporter ClcA
MEVPAWAYDFCYYYMAIAIVTALYGVYAIYRVFTLPSIVQKFVPTVAITLSIALGGVLSVVLAMMQFWICRSALEPRGSKKEEAAPQQQPPVELSAVSAPMFASVEGFRDRRRY